MRRAWPWVGSCLLVAVAACGGGGAAADARPPVLRTDAGPLAERFPAIGTPVSAVWLVEPLGVADARVPGPSDYRTTAVVRLDPATADRLVALADPAPTTVGEITPLVRPYLPPGPLRAGERLDAALAPAGTAVDARLDPATDDLVLVAITT